MKKKRKKEEPLFDREPPPIPQLALHDPVSGRAYKPRIVSLLGEIRRSLTKGENE